jgi:hypothetical protein
MAARPVAFPRCLVLGLVLLAPAIACSAELTPFVHEGRLGVQLTHTHLPPSLRKDLVSGLTNRIVVRIELLAGGQLLARKVLDIGVKYDLWDEDFSLQVRNEEGGVVARTYTSADQVVAALSDLRLPALFPAALVDGQSRVLTAEVLFDPIEKEQLEEIRKWVAENSAAVPPMPYGAGLPAAAPLSTSRALFNRIFAQYAAGSSLAAAWKDGAVSRPFRLADLPDEPVP